MSQSDSDSHRPLSGLLVLVPPAVTLSEAKGLAAGEAMAPFPDLSLRSE